MKKGVTERGESKKGRNGEWERWARGRMADGLGEKAVGHNPLGLRAACSAAQIARSVQARSQSRSGKMRLAHWGLWPYGLVGLVGWAVILLGLSNSLNRSLLRGAQVETRPSQRS